MKKQELVELINKWKSGDEDAYNIIYNEYHDRMLKIALSHTQVSGHSNMADAEDVVQDAMLKAYINIQSLDDPNKFEGWLTKIVVNKANDYMTSAMKKRNVLQTDYAKDDGEGNTLEFDAEDEKRERQPEIKLDAEVKQNIVQDILSGLSEDQRAVTLMYYYDEMSMKEIAEQLGIEMSTVVGRLQIAKKNIKNEVTAIQKRDDIKLYNLSAIPAIPFFMAMLGTAKETAAVPVTTGVATVTETLASEVAQGSQSPSSVAHSTTEVTKTPVENVSNNSANVAESPTSSFAEETVSNTAKATAKVAEEGAKATASSATTASASVIASTTAGASFATKLVVGIAVVATATGGGIILKNSFASNNSQPPASVVEEPVATEEQSGEEQDDQKTEADNEAEDQKEIDRQRNNLGTVENSAYASRVDQINQASLFKMSEKADEYMNDKFEQVSYLCDYVRYTTSSMQVILKSGSLREKAEDVTIDYNYYGRLYSFVEGGKTYYFYIEFCDVRKDGAELDLDNIYSEPSYRMWDDLDLLKKNKEDYSTGVDWNF